MVHISASRCCFGRDFRIIHPSQACIYSERTWELFLELADFPQLAQLDRFIQGHTTSILLSLIVIRWDPIPLNRLLLCRSWNLGCVVLAFLWTQPSMAHIFLLHCLFLVTWKPKQVCLFFWIGFAYCCHRYSTQGFPWSHNEANQHGRLITSVRRSMTSRSCRQAEVQAARARGLA